MNRFSFANGTKRALATLALIITAFLFAGHHPASNAVTLEQPTTEQSAKIDAIFVWAEAQPSVALHLGGTASTQVGQGYVYRAYQTKNYLAATNTELYAYGPATNFTLLFLGKVNDFYCSIVTCTQPLRYTDKVYAIWTGAQIFAVERRSDNTFSVEKVKNMSQYQFGAWPLFNCGLYKTPLQNGTILASCVVASDSIRRFFVIDPLKQELNEYTGQAPESTSSPNWSFVQSYDPSIKPEWSKKTQVSYGWYYETNANVAQLLFSDNSGNTTIVKTGTFTADGNIRNLLTFNN